MIMSVACHREIPVGRDAEFEFLLNAHASGDQ
jgi:hypothetical protein